MAPPLSLWSDGNVIRGLAVRGTPGIAIAVWGSRNVVEDNYIGTDPTGQTPLGSGIGISVETRTCPGACSAPGAIETFPTATGNVIRRNVISGNRVGVLIKSAEDTQVQGNLIGTDATGTVALGNADHGIELIGARTSRIGGTSPSERNIISGSREGVWLGRGSAQNVIEGNYIGTDLAGSTALPNDNGVYFKVSEAGQQLVDNIVGGTTPGAANLISGNRTSGVWLGGARNRIEGDRIGTNATGLASIPNGAGVVVAPFSNEGDNVVARNTIAFNLGAGVRYGGNPIDTVDPLTVTITRNSIFGNGALGIDLGPLGVTPNDPGDSDTGPNGLQNFPVLLAAVPTGDGVLLVGSIDSPNPRTITVELFANDSADPSGYGEGQRFLGTVTPLPNGCFITRVATLGAGPFITSTATDASGNTSEFSAALRVGTGQPRAIARCAAGR